MSYTNRCILPSIGSSGTTTFVTGAFDFIGFQYTNTGAGLSISLTAGAYIGQTLCIMCLNGSPGSPTITGGGGSLTKLTGGSSPGSITFSEYDSIELFWDGAVWVELSRSGNVFP